MGLSSPERIPPSSVVLVSSFLGVMLPLVAAKRINYGPVYWVFFFFKHL